MSKSNQSSFDSSNASDENYSEGEAKSEYDRAKATTEAE